MAFNTGNAVGSTDPRDLSDNAENLDRFANGTNAAYDDRLGVNRKSLAGMESDFATDQSERATTFANFLASSGYVGTGTGGAIEDYAGGIEITEYNQLIRESGEFYRAKASLSLPYTTTGTWVGDDETRFVSVGDAALRQEIGSGIFRADSLANLESSPGRFDGDAARLVSGTGRDGDFRWDSSDLSSTLVVASATSDSVDDTTDTINDADHPFSDGDGVITQTTVNGLTAQTVYWVVNSTAGTYQLSATFGGGAIDLTGTTNVTIDKLLDPRQRIYVTPTDDKTGASGAWVFNSDGFPDPIAPAYLKTVSDMISGSDVSVLRFIDRSEHAKIRSGTSTADLNARFQDAVDSISAQAGRGSVMVPYGKYYKPGTLSMPANIRLFSEGGGHIHADDGGLMIDIDAAVAAALGGLTLESTAAGDAVRVNGFCASNIDRLDIKGFRRGVWESGFGSVGENYITRCNIETTDVADSFGIWADSTDNYHFHNKVKGCNTAFRARGGANRFSDNHSFRSPSADTAIGYLVEGIETQINGGRTDTCSDAAVFFGGQGVGNTCSISGLFMGTASTFAGAAFLGLDGAQILELDDVYSIPVDATITDGTTTGKVYLTDSNGAGGNTRAYVNRRDGIILNSASVTIDGTINATVVARVRPRIVGLNVTGSTFSNAEVAANGVAGYRIDDDVDLSDSERTNIKDNTFINTDAFSTSVKRTLTFNTTNSGSTNLVDYLVGPVAQVRFSQLGGNETFKLDTVTNEPNRNVAFVTESGANTTTEAKVFVEAESYISNNGKDFFGVL